MACTMDLVKMTQFIVHTQIVMECSDWGDVFWIFDKPKTIWLSFKICFKNWAISHNINYNSLNTSFKMKDPLYGLSTFYLQNVFFENWARQGITHLADMSNL